GASLRLERLIEDIEAGNHRASFRGRHVAGQDAHGRRLARAIRTEEAEYLSSFHLEADVVDGRDATVPFADVLNFYHSNTPWSRSAAGSVHGACREKSRPCAWAPPSARANTCVRYRQQGR